MDTLQEVRHHLLDLHRALVETERKDYGCRTVNFTTKPLPSLP